MIKNRKELPENAKEQLEEILMDSDKAQNVIDLARSSMGMFLLIVQLYIIISTAVIKK